MCCAASFWMVSASSWSLIEGSEIFFTITECPLTAVATAFDLICVSVNSLAMALETVPESTIMESTTMSGAIGSRPRCATSIPVRVLRNSTALMLEEPTSSPTIVFDPIPNMCPPFFTNFAYGVRLRSSGSFHRCLDLLFAPWFQFHRLLFHPLIKLRFLEAPAVAQLERRNPLFVHVLVQRVRTHSQILGSLANVHHFSRVGHNVSLSQRIQLPAQPFLPGNAEEFGRTKSSIQRVRVYFGVLSISQPVPRASQHESPGFSGFYGVFLDFTKSGVAVHLYISWL